MMDGQGELVGDEHEGPTDDGLSEEVHRALLGDAQTANLDLEVSARDGVITLRGSVMDVVDIDNALAVAGRVRGVSDVVDEMEVEQTAG